LQAICLSVYVLWCTQAYTRRPSQYESVARDDGGTGSDKRFSPLLVRSNLGLSQSRSGSAITPSFRWNGFCSFAFAVFSVFALFVLSCSALRYPRIAHMPSPLDRYSALADSLSTSLDRTEPGAFTNILCLCVIDQAIIMGLWLCVTVTRLIGFGPVLEFCS
jgi:Na+/H+ antiporter NhaC